MLKTKTVEVPDVTFKKEEEDHEKVLEVYREQDQLGNPREEWVIGTMLCAHGRYELGDRQINVERYGSWNEVRRDIEENEDPAVILPLYLYDHHGVTIKVGSFNGQLPQGHARFDSGQVGFIYVTEDRIEKLELEEKSKEEIEEMLKNEVKEYDYYLSGQIWRYTLKAISGEEEEYIDSCGGFRGPLSEVIPRMEETAGVEDLEEWDREDAY